MPNIRDIRDPKSRGKVKKLFCRLEKNEDGTARFVAKGKNMNVSIDVEDFLNQIPKEYIVKLK